MVRGRLAAIAAKRAPFPGPMPSRASAHSYLWQRVDGDGHDGQTEGYDKEAGYAFGQRTLQAVIYSARFQLASARPPVDKARAVNVSWSPVIAKMRF